MIEHGKTAEFGTNCGECVFLADDSFSCKLKRLEKYREQGVVEERDGVPYVKDRICITLRPEEWEGDENTVRDEVRAKVDLVIAFDTDNDPITKDAFPALCRTAEFFNSVIVVTKSADLVNELYDVLETELPEGVKYQVVHSLEEEESVERLWDLGVQKCKGMWYMCIDSEWFHNSMISSAVRNFNNLKVAFDNLDEYVNGQLNQVQYVAADPHINRLFPQLVGVKIHQLLNGNDGGYVEDKIKALADAQNAHHLIHKWEDINAV